MKYPALFLEPNVILVELPNEESIIGLLELDSVEDVFGQFSIEDIDFSSEDRKLLEEYDIDILDVVPDTEKEKYLTLTENDANSTSFRAFDMITAKIDV